MIDDQGQGEAAAPGAADERQGRDAQGRDAQGRWTPGTSGNPGGRARNEACLTPLIRRRLDAPVTLADGRKTKMAEAVVGRLIAMALAGDLGAIRTLLDRMDGKVAWRVNLDGDGPVAVFLPLAGPPDESREPRMGEADAGGPPAGDGEDPPVAGGEARDDAEEGGA